MPNRKLSHEGNRRKVCSPCSKKIYYYKRTQFTLEIKEFVNENRIFWKKMIGRAARISMCIDFESWGDALKDSITFFVDV